MRLPTSVFALAALVFASCDTAPTAPPPILAAAGAFEFTVTGAIVTSPTGDALYEDGPSGLRVDMQSDVPLHNIRLQPGVLSSGTFAYPVGKHGMSGPPGFAEIELRYEASIDPEDLYVSTSGTLRVVESAVDHVIGSVDVRAVSSTGAAIRIRGSFHALVVP